MGMESRYKKQILEEILKEYLDQDQIPTADQLQDAYEARAYEDMTVPILSREIAEKKHIVEHDSESSATAFNGFFGRTLKDLEALYDETWDLTMDGMTSFDRWRFELEALRKELVNLESRIDSLLLLRQDTSGYFNFVGDNFVDLSKVDQDNSTVHIDVRKHMVTIGENSATSTKVLPNDISASFTVLSRDDLATSNNAPGTTVEDAISDLSTHWQRRVWTNKGDKPISVELKFKLSKTDSPVSVSRIVFELHSADNNSNVLVTGMYSTDNYNWYNLPTDNYAQSVEETAVFSLDEAIDILWMKFILTKTGPDDILNGLYVYEFGAKTVDFYGIGFDTSKGQILQSIELSAYDDDKNRIGFNKIALETCQQVPDDTHIEYWVTAKNSSAATPATRIAPYNISNPDAPTELDLGRTIKTEASSLVMVYKSNGRPSPQSAAYFAQFATLESVGGTALIGTDTLTPYMITSDTFDNLVNNSILLYRNVGPQYGDVTDDTGTVRGAPRGWRYDSTKTYLLTTLVLEEDVVIDFGPEVAYLDGIEIKDAVPISAGVHTFRTHIKNTGSILTQVSDVPSLKLLDSIYPYNHQKLVEGYNYPSDFTGEQVYTGVDLYSEYVIQPQNRVSVFDLFHNVAADDYSRYAIDSFTDATYTLGATKYVFLVRFDNEGFLGDGTDDEAFALSFYTGNNVFDRVVLKAKLTTDNDAKTPILTAYRIKLGA